MRKFQIEKSTGRFLGFDVGTHRLGYAAIYWTRSLPRILKLGMIVKDKEFSFKNDFRKIESAIKEIKPKLVVLEKIYFSKNVTNALYIAEIQGLIKYACSKNNADFIEVHPRTLKLKITGDGNSDKEDMKYYINFWFKSKKIKNDLPDDIYDALALALYGSLILA